MLTHLAHKWRFHFQMRAKYIFFSRSFVKSHLCSCLSTYETQPSMRMSIAQGIYGAEQFILSRKFNKRILSLDVLRQPRQDTICSPYGHRGFSIFYFVLKRRVVCSSPTGRLHVNIVQQYCSKTKLTYTQQSLQISGNCVKVASVV